MAAAPLLKMGFVRHYSSKALLVAGEPAVRCLDVRDQRKDS